MTNKLFGLAAAAAVSLTLLTGCPAEEKKETTTTTTTTTESTAPAATETTATEAAIDAKAIFASKCAACHGATGGGGVGPNLTAVDAKGDAYIHDMIMNGKGAMPPFKEQLKPAEVDALVAYVKAL